MTTSAALLLHRDGPSGLEVLLVHPGGPYWAKKDEGAWSVPKGELDPDEDPHAAALREFTEELGLAPPPADGPDVDLGEIRQRSGKRVRCWARAGDLEVGELHGEQIEIEWPPRSGRRLTIPEIDRAEWFPIDVARAKLLAAQVELLDRLLTARSA
jgi:predicted NUDIX family NTP pyrophosphohydrolase